MFSGTLFPVSMIDGDNGIYPISLQCGNGELHLGGWMLDGCKFIVMNFCLMNKGKALRSVLAISHNIC